MKIFSVICVFASLAASSAKASMLNLTPSTPDFMTSFLSVSYNAASNLFQANGFTSDYQGGSASLLNLGSYSLTATITPAGILTGGALTIRGDIGTGQETLLSGIFKTGASGTAFGFQDPSAPATRNLFEFLFTVTGGDSKIVQDFGGLGAANRGLIINAFFQNGGTPFNGTWAGNFSNDGISGVSDNFIQVPEPSTAALLLLAGGAWLISANRSRAKTAVLAVRD